jgi:hypothetical protein
MIKMIPVIFPALLSAVLLMGCSKPLPDKATTIVALQQMQDLATVEYTLTKVVKASDDATWFKFGDRKILITCEASVKAGIDFTQVDPKYVQLEGKTILLQLPAPKILSVNMPPQNIRVAYQEIDFFRDHFSVAEQNSLMQQAERQIITQSREMGILQEAEKNTREWLTRYLKQLGYQNIDIQFIKNFTSTPS